MVDYFRLVYSDTGDASLKLDRLFINADKGIYVLDSKNSALQHTTLFADEVNGFFCLAKHPTNEKEQWQYQFFLVEQISSVNLEPKQGITIQLRDNAESHELVLENYD